MKIDLPVEVIKIMEDFSRAGHEVYLVGGSVRDLLSHNPVKDWDFTTNALPEQILALYPQGYYNNKFGTVGIPLSAISQKSNSLSNIIEITTMRKEGMYVDNRHPENVSWTDKIEEDLARRDFTINAMALRINNSHFDKNFNISWENISIIDPFGGQNDLKEEKIKAVGEAEQRFKEDALRLMRAIRFTSQFGFTLDITTENAIKQYAPLIQNISWERIRDELFKILASKFYFEGIVLLKETGLLQFIVPEIERCFGIKQTGPKHDRKYDIGEHLLLSLKNCPSPDPYVRFACLIHDIGKPDTMNIQEDGNVTFYGHDIVGGKIALSLCNRLRIPKKESEKITKLVRYHMFTLDEHQTDSAVRRFIRNIGVENIDNMMAVRIGDRLGGGTVNGVSWRMEKFRERIDQVLQKPFSLTDLKINGNDVMESLQIQPSRKVGDILNQLFNEVEQEPNKNNRQYLLKRLKDLN